MHSTKLTAALVAIVFGITCSTAGAGPVKKQAFQPDEISELNQQQLASMDELENVDAGVYGLLNSLLRLGLTAGAAYLAYKAIEDN